MDSINEKQEKSKDVDVLQEIEDELPNSSIFPVTDSLLKEPMNFLMVFRLVHKYKAAHHHHKHKQTDEQVSSFNDIMLVGQVEIRSICLEKCRFFH